MMSFCFYSQMDSLSTPSRCLNCHCFLLTIESFFDYFKAILQCCSRLGQWCRTGAGYHDLGSMMTAGFIAFWLFGGCSTGRCTFSGMESLAGSGWPETANMTSLQASLFNGLFLY